MPGAKPRRQFLAISAALAVIAWAALWLWGSGPYSRFLDHGDWIDANSALAMCRALPGGEVLVPLALYIGGWLLMTTAMMLPTTLPLLDRFDRLVRGRSDRRLLLALVIGGYLVVWLGFGAVTHLVDAELHQAAQRSSWLLFNGWVIGAAIFAIAGLFQFSGLKYHCLTKCRTPFSFIAKHWHGPSPYRNALLLVPRPRSVLRWLLLGDHAADVCRRQRQYRLDAGARRDHGRREKPTLGRPSRPAARRRAAGRRRSDRDLQPQLNRGKNL